MFKRNLDTCCDLLTIPYFRSRNLKTRDLVIAFNVGRLKTGLVMKPSRSTTGAGRRPAWEDDRHLKIQTIRVFGCLFPAIESKQFSI